MGEDTRDMAAGSGAVAGANAAATPQSSIVYIVAPVFFVLAAWFVFGPDLSEVPEAATPKLNKAFLVPGPLREVLITTDPPKLSLHSFERTCMECHRAFENKQPRMDDLQQHAHIEMRHGINTHCYHCHDFENRDKLVRRDGETLPYTRVPELCGQCHTRIHEDWQHGVHGKRLGYWDAERGEQKPIVCTGCHDPHWPSRPAMSGVKPMAGPNTLRMGDHAEHEVHAHGPESDPLQRAIQNGTDGK